MLNYFGVSCLVLQILLNQMAAFVFSNFSLRLNRQLQKHQSKVTEKLMQPFGLTYCVKPSKWRQNTATSKSKEMECDNL
jgi:hypothetical protein